jgi:hypothetical protein
MHERKETLPVLLSAPGATLRATRWGSMSVAHVECAKGTDFTPLLKGLQDDMCQCPHWGCVLKGSLHMRYTDGTEEVIVVGEMWHAKAGHTVWCDEDTEFIDVSPADEFAHVINHVHQLMNS